MSQMRAVKSFVLRSGRMTSRQQNGLEKILPDYALTLEQPMPWDLGQSFRREAPVFVEIGFGMGATLATMAAQRPEDNFIGVEVHRSGVGSLAADLSEQAIHNVRIAMIDAVAVFDTCLQPNSISGVYILFPDPWPKKKHHKRRLIQRSFIQKIVQALKPGGFIHCATDWEDYAREILLVLSETEQLENTAKEGGYVSRPDWRPMTRFELRGLKLGHGVWDLCFVRQN